MKSFLSLLFILCLSGTLAAQNSLTTLAGHLKDTSGRQSLDFATVSVIHAKDSSLYSFTRTDSNGNFQFKNIPPGRYRLSATHTGFYPAWKEFTIKANDVTDLGEIIMVDKSSLKEVVITSEIPPVVVNGDTLEFNASSFKTKNNAVVEDLLKKMPGVQVDKDGTVRVNGQRINRILVNGKEFFTGDPKLATRNLPADAVDKVQVFEKKSDQAEFTGMNDGASETAINLKLKKDKSKAAFGKISAGAGTANRYDGQFNVNKINGEKQLSAIGMANNTNRQGFSLMDVLNFTGETNRMMRGGGGGRIVINNGNGPDFGVPVQGGGGNNPGVSRTIAGGLNFNNTFKKKTDVNGSYFYNNVAVGAQQSTDRAYVIPGNSYKYLNESIVNRLNSSNRVNLTVDHKIDSFNSVKLTSSVTEQKNSTNNFNAFNSIDSSGNYLNEGMNNSSAEANGYNVTNNLLLKHKFRKKGRTISANLSMTNNSTRSSGTQESYTNFYSSGNPAYTDTINQQNKLHSKTNSYNSSLNYTEPLGKRTLLEFNGFYSMNSGQLDKKTFDFNSNNGKYDRMNTIQSSAFKSDYRYTGGGASVRVQQKKYGFSVGANVQQATLGSTLIDSSFSIHQLFTSILPVANFNYSFSRMKNLRVNYTTSTKQPGTAQLQPVKDVSDPLYTREGNPNLKQEYTHDVNFQYFSANPALQKNFMAFVNFSTTKDAIVNSETTDNVGTRNVKPVNTKSIYTLMGTINTAFRIKPIKTRLEVGANIFTNQNKNYVNNNLNDINTTSYAPRMSLNYGYKEVFDITAAARISYNQARYSLFKSLNNNYWQKEYSADMNVNAGGVSLNTEFTYTDNSGRTAGFNQNSILWNASISKQFLKSKKAEVKLSVNDLLNQNIGISRNSSQSYVEDVRVKTLQRFFLLTFTYNLNKPAGNGGVQAVMRRF